MDLKSFLANLSIGLSGKPIPISGGEPVAYLYNGVRLPKLPDAPEGHEFILLAANNSAYAEVYYSTTPFYLESEGAFDSKTLCAKEDGEYIRYYYDTTVSLDGPYDYQLDNNGPYAFVAGDSIYGLQYTTKCIRWANYNVRRFDDDTIWLDKTEPIPVYE